MIYSYLSDIASKQIKKITTDNNINVGVSGGIDSMALVIALHEIGYNVTALIIDHKIHKLSTKHAEITIERLEKFGIRSKCFTWNRNDEIKGNIEAEARKFRYDTLINATKTDGNKILCLGHHLNDQVETFLMNISRGSGLDGLCAMPNVRLHDDVFIIRPFLWLSKNEIIKYVTDNQIEYIIDPINEDLSLKRNALRSVLSNISDLERLYQRIGNTIQRLQGAKIIVDKIHNNNWNQNIKIENNTYIISTEYILSIEPEEAMMLLSDTFKRCGNYNIRGRFKQIERLYDMIVRKNYKKYTLRRCNIMIDKKWIKISKQSI